MWPECFQMLMEADWGTGGLCRWTWPPPRGQWHWRPAGGPDSAGTGTHYAPPTWRCFDKGELIMWLPPCISSSPVSLQGPSRECMKVCLSFHFYTPLSFPFSISMYLYLCACKMHIVVLHVHAFLSYANGIGYKHHFLIFTPALGF